MWQPFSEFTDLPWNDIKGFSFKYGFVNRKGSLML